MKNKIRQFTLFILFSLGLLLISPAESIGNNPPPPPTNGSNGDQSPVGGGAPIGGGVGILVILATSYGGIKTLQGKEKKPK